MSSNKSKTQKEGGKMPSREAAAKGKNKNSSSIVEAKTVMPEERVWWLAPEDLPGVLAMYGFFSDEVIKSVVDQLTNLSESCVESWGGKLCFPPPGPHGSESEDVVIKYNWNTVVRKIASSYFPGVPVLENDFTSRHRGREFFHPTLTGFPADDSQASFFFRLLSSSIGDEFRVLNPPPLEFRLFLVKFYDDDGATTMMLPTFSEERIPGVDSRLWHGYHDTKQMRRP